MTNQFSAAEKIIVNMLRSKITGTSNVFKIIIQYSRPPILPKELQRDIQNEGKRVACLHLLRCVNKTSFKAANRVMEIAEGHLNRLENSMEPEEEEYEGCCYDSYRRCPANPDRNPTYAYHRCCTCYDRWGMCYDIAQEEYGHNTSPYFLDQFYDIDQLYWLCENNLVEGSKLIPSIFAEDTFSLHDRRFSPTNLLFDMLRYMEYHYNTTPKDAPQYHMPGSGYGINYSWEAHMTEGSCIENLY